MVFEHRRQVIDSAFLGSLETLDLYIKTVMRGHFGGQRKTDVYGNSVEFADYRDYAQGDDLRQIDWNLVARFERYYIKQFLDEHQLQTCVYIDLSASMDAEDGKGLTALRLAAAMGFLSVQNMDRAAYRLLQGDKCTDLCGTVMGREAFYQAAEALETLSFSGDTDLFEAIRADASPGTGNGLSVIISDFLTDSDWKGAVDYLLSRHREVALVQVLSPQEVSPLYRGRLELADAETGARGALRLAVDRGAVRAYADALRYLKEDMAQFCLSRDVPLLTVNSAEPLEQAILEKGYTVGLIR